MHRLRGELSGGKHSDQRIRERHKQHGERDEREHETPDAQVDRRPKRLHILLDHEIGQLREQRHRNGDDEDRERQNVPEIARQAWGYIEYKEALTEIEAAAYELIPSNRISETENLEARR